VYGHGSFSITSYDTPIVGLFCYASDGMRIFSGLSKLY